MKKAYVVAVSICMGGLAMAGESTVYPGATWARREPREAGLDMEALNRIGELMRKAKANGVLIHKGYLVAEWSFDEPAGKRFNIQSCCTPIPFPIRATRPKTAEGEITPNARYGLAWRGLAREDGRVLWHMSGYGGQFCIIEPGQDLVLVKVNRWEVQPFTEIGRFEKAIWALTPPQPAQQEALK